MTRSEAEELWGLLLDIAKSVNVARKRKPSMGTWSQLVNTCSLIGIDDSLCRCVWCYNVHLDDKWKLEFMIHCGVPTDDKE